MLDWMCGLAPVRDPIHGFLLDAFVARATDYRAALAVLDECYPLLNRVARYKIDRLREDVVLLQAARGVDSMGDFQQERASAPPVGLRSRSSEGVGRSRHHHQGEGNF